MPDGLLVVSIGRFPAGLLPAPTGRSPVGLLPAPAGLLPDGLRLTEVPAGFGLCVPGFLTTVDSSVVATEISSSLRMVLLSRLL